MCLQNEYESICGECEDAGLPAWADVSMELANAQAHRDYWKPKKVKVVLLAESHVKTSSQEAQLTLNYPGEFPADIPNHFVRLVYCLGYGENSLFKNGNAPSNNPGTNQFWKIFQATGQHIPNTGNLAWLRMRESSVERMNKKKEILRSMKQRGIWLVDASLPALYHPRDGTPQFNQAIRARIIRSSWHYWTCPLLQALNPQHIIVIGCGVNNAVYQFLYDEYHGRVTVLPQPQAHLQGGYLPCLQTIHAICSAHVANP